MIRPHSIHPVRLQVLHVEQEVSGGEMTVRECVLSADLERTALLAEEAKLLGEQKKEDEEEEGKGGKAGGEGGEGKSADDPSSRRLMEIYKRMEVIDAHTAESRASAILAVSTEWQLIYLTMMQ